MFQPVQSLAMDFTIPKNNAVKSRKLAVCLMFA